MIKACDNPQSNVTLILFQVQIRQDPQGFKKRVLECVRKSQEDL